MFETISELELSFTPNKVVLNIFVARLFDIFAVALPVYFKTPILKNAEKITNTKYEKPIYKVKLFEIFIYVEVLGNTLFYGD